MPTDITTATNPPRNEPGTIAPAREGPPADPDAALALLQPWKQTFVRCLRGRPDISSACRESRVSRGSAYRARDADPLFAELWDEALESCADAVEGALHHEATTGTTKRIFRKDGTLIHEETRRDVRAMEIYLKGNRPGKYREKAPATPEANETLQAVVERALGRGLLHGIGAKLADRFGAKEAVDKTLVETAERDVTPSEPTPASLNNADTDQSQQAAP